MLGDARTSDLGRQSQTQPPHRIRTEPDREMGLEVPTREAGFFPRGGRGLPRGCIVEMSLPGGTGVHQRRWLCLIHDGPGSVKGQGPRSGQRIIKISEEEEVMVVLEA